jgi:hypothetical protein
MLQDDAKQDVQAAPGVAPCTGSLNPPSQDFAYQLRGAQVEPDAGKWLTGSTISVPTLPEVVDYAEGANAQPRWHLTPSLFLQQSEIDHQLEILRQLVPDRDDYPYPGNRTYTVGTQALKLTPLSRFL